MPVTVREAVERSDLRLFVDFPWTIYRGDPNWVPPLKSETWGIITGKDNPLFTCGPHALFLAEDRGRVVGRVMAAVDNELNFVRGNGWGYFSLFESVNDISVASALLGACETWVKERGCRVCRGPVSPDNGDDNRGLLIEGFDSPPVLMDSYNPTYYIDLIEACGYRGDGDDRLAYRYLVPPEMPEKVLAAIAYAESRWGYHVDRVDLRNIEKEFECLKVIVDAAMPEWPDMIPPTMDEIHLMAKKVLPVAVADFIFMARSNGGEPIGFLLALPDYNQAFRHMNGTLFPFGWAKFLWYRRKIDACRAFVLFVVPAWQKRGVSHAMFAAGAKSCYQRGIKWAEGSTIVRSNRAMNRDALGAGGELYKTFRTYEKPV